MNKEVIILYTVYVHINKTNGKRYVGITSGTVSQRWHRGKGYSDKLPIGRAFKKYGWDGFEHQILYTNLTAEEAKKIEIELIKEWRTQEDEYGYNITSGGDGVTGWHPSKETRAKMSKASQGRYGPLNPNYGKRWTDEMKQTASIQKRRENLSEDTLRKMSESAKKLNRVGEQNNFYGKKHTDKTKKIISDIQSRAVNQLDLNGNFIKTFKSLKEAGAIVGVTDVAISNCCRGVTATSAGYKWEYTNKE